MNPWDAIEAGRPGAHQVGGYTIAALAYTVYAGTPRQYHVKGKVWIENVEGEGMEADATDIPEGVTEEWLDEFWRRNF